MKLLITTTVALSLAAAAAAAATAPSAPRASLDSARPAAHPSHLQQFAQRRGKCTERLGYGRTGSYGCG